MIDMSFERKLCRILFATIALLGTLLPARMLLAHEVTPSIINFVIDGSTIDVDVSLNIESFVARLDLESLTNTNDSESPRDYDRFRARPPAELEEAFREFWPDMTRRFTLHAQHQLELMLDDVEIPETGNFELPRESKIAISAQLPADTKGVAFRWPADYGMLVIRQQGVEKPYTGMMASGGISDLIPVSGGTDKSAWQHFLEYIPVGFDHIVPKGLDHILFVLGLFFLSTRLAPLIWQISVFTVAHTVTLALGALGWVNIPGSIVEPLIAASIVYVAIENIFTDSLKPSRTLVIFAFGLLHGLGFASVLGEFGLPDEGFIPALLGFNVGVEVGQLTVVAVAFFALAIWFRNHPGYRRWIAVPASVIIGLIGAWWFVERVFLS